MADVDTNPANASAAAGVGQSLDARARFLEFYDFILDWGDLIGKEGDKARGELDREVFQRWLLPVLAAKGETGLKGQSFSDFLGHTVKNSLPSWFQNRVRDLLKTPERYEFLLPAQSPHEIGRIANFRILRVIGEGGMGIVYEASRIEPSNSLLKFDKRYAVKVIHPNQFCPELETRFVQEARLLGGLKGRNVADVFEAARTRGDKSVPYLAMEYIRGLTLHDLVDHHAEHPMPLAVALDLIRQITHGLETIHASDSIKAHRDLKPGNILLQHVNCTSDTPLGWHAYICDIGLALPATGPRLSEVPRVVGTPGFRAPEQISKPDTVDERSDIFSLGIISSLLLTGQHPFGYRENFPATPRAMPEGIPPHVAACVQNMLEMDPEDRTTSKAEIIAITTAELLSVSKSPESRAVGRFRRGLKWISGTVIAFALVFLCIAFVHSQMKDPPFAISGRVRHVLDSNDPQHSKVIPVAGARITVVSHSAVGGGKSFTITDAEGKYSLTGLLRGVEEMVDLEIEATGYPTAHAKQGRNTNSHTIELVK